ncbi:hypothetical protein [Nitritalea halalkaliphila]|uniref:hypothetical protein n=1 Tax=Nitritalea halalkaliphila TaxID=590849 RepID=UPI002934B937|nr:hypothetical protein [Nitritalea halalkaliphila]
MHHTGQQWENFSDYHGLCRPNRSLYAGAGRRRLNEFKPNFIGGNAAKVVMRAAQDVVLVPKKGYFKPPRKVVYATNYLEEDKIAIQKVTHFASFFDAEVDIVHVSSKSKAIDRALHQTMVQELKPYVRYPKSSFVLKTYRDEPGLGLENYLKVAKGDILVTLTKKKSWFDQLFAQNLSKKMSYFINKPLWAVKML